MQSVLGRKSLSRTLVSVAATSVAALAEILVFHPVDTVVKRLQADTSTERLTREHLSAIIFRDAKDKPPLAKYRSLFPGFSFAVAYKVCVIFFCTNHTPPFFPSLSLFF